MAQEFEVTAEMRAAIGVESDGWPVEFTSTGIRAFARGVGIEDHVYYVVDAARAAGARGVLVPNPVTRPEEIARAREVASDLAAAVELVLAR